MNIHRPFLPISAPPPPPPPFCLQCLSTAPGGEKEHPSIQSIQASSRTCGASGVGAPSLSVPLIQGRETVPCHCHAMSGRRTTDGIIANEGRPRGHPLSPSLLLPLSLPVRYCLPSSRGFWKSLPAGGRGSWQGEQHHALSRAAEGVAGWVSQMGWMPGRGERDLLDRQWALSFWFFMSWAVGASHIRKPTLFLLVHA